MRAFVTGLGGFIGSRLGRLLGKRGDRVLGVVRPGRAERIRGELGSNVELVEADLADAGAYRSRLLEFRPEQAFHAAWYTRHGEYWEAPENLGCVRMTLSLAENLARAGCSRILCIGSCAEYDWFQEGPLVEGATPTRPDSLYGVAKNATRQILEAWAPGAGVALAWARLFFPFGPGEAGSRLIPSVASALARGETVRCTHGRQLRDFIYVEDCATALVAIADGGLTGCVNVGRGEPVSIHRVVEILAALAGRPIERVRFGALEPGRREPPRVVADVRRLTDEAGWHPAWTLEDALAETLDAWRRHP